jgi:hypothetical protein
MEIVEIKNWASPEIKTITITQEVKNTSYVLRVREFVPELGDCLERQWKSNGEQRSHKTAPYAIVDMKETGKRILRFVDDNVAVSIRHYIDRTDKLLYPVYDMALWLQDHAEVRIHCRSHCTLLKALIFAARGREKDHPGCSTIMDSRSHGVPIGVYYWWQHWRVPWDGASSS